MQFFFGVSFLIKMRNDARQNVGIMMAGLCGGVVLEFFNSYHFDIALGDEDAS